MGLHASVGTTSSTWRTAAGFCSTCWITTSSVPKPSVCRAFTFFWLIHTTRPMTWSSLIATVNCANSFAWATIAHCRCALSCTLFMVVCPVWFCPFSIEIPQYRYISWWKSFAFVRNFVQFSIVTRPSSSMPLMHYWVKVIVTKNHSVSSTEVSTSGGTSYVQRTISATVFMAKS